MIDKKTYPHYNSNQSEAIYINPQSINAETDCKTPNSEVLIMTKFVNTPPKEVLSNIQNFIVDE